MSLPDNATPEEIVAAFSKLLKISDRNLSNNYQRLMLVRPIISILSLKQSRIGAKLGLK